MGYRRFFIFVLLLLMGCVTSKAQDVQRVNDDYKTVVFTDGIGEAEAKIIAQMQVVKKNVADLYHLSKPKITDDVEELPGYQNYWFVFFEEKMAANIPFIFMVIIDRQTGKVKFADDYNEGNQWILEAALLR